MIIEYLMQNLDMFKKLFRTLEGSFEIRPFFCPHALFLNIDLHFQINEILSL